MSDPPKQGDHLGRGLPVGSGTVLSGEGAWGGGRPAKKGILGAPGHVESATAAAK